jgi:hypothetical protein
MAKDQGLQDTSKTFTNSFTKGLNKDSDPSFVSEGMWTHAINVVNNTIEGDVGTLSNETSNILCARVGRSMPASVVEKFILGAIYLYSDKWIIYSVGYNITGLVVTSEIGLLEEDVCNYREIVQDPCLNFDKHYLISGASREKEDCSWQVYWADGYNPDRFLNIGDPKLWPTPDYQWVGGSLNMNFYSNGVDTNFLWPGVQWEQKCGVPTTPCEFCVDDNKLDCPKTRLARLMETPCLNLILGQSGGTLANGTYFAVIAYTIKGQRVTDWFSQSNFQFIYTENDLEGSLTLEVNADSENFDEFVLAIVESTNQQTVATEMGIYSTKTSRIAIDQINPSNIKVPLEQIPIQTPVFETSDQITDVNNYLLRVGPRSKFDFNYQPLANMIRTKWASVEYPADYYIKGGNKTNYLRDEVYTFYIRWVYDTGDKSASYHIPGRAPRNFQVPGGISMAETDSFTVTNDQNVLATDDQVFEVYNTASLGFYPTTLPGATLNSNGKWVLPDGGVLLAVGEMGYWQSTEVYPDNRPDIWNSSTYCWTGPNAQIQPGQTTGTFDLCGKHIRHHKFPEDYINNNATTDAMHFRPTTNAATTGDEFFIRIMGVIFENITMPKDQDGKDIPDIVGYEILRGSREGNKTIVAKGMVNNFRTFELKGALAKNRTGLYPNYPYNTIQPIGWSINQNDHNYNVNDPYIKNIDNNDDVVNQDIPTDIFTFHSPDTMFRTPFLSTTEFKLYGSLNGYADMNFQEPNGHPKWKLLSDYAVLPMIIGGVAEAIISLIGKRTVNEPVLTSYTEQLRGAGGAGAINLTLGPTGVGAIVTPGTTAPGTGGQIVDSAAQDSALTAIDNAITNNVTGWNTFIQDYYTNGTAVTDALTALVQGYGGTTYATRYDTLISTINNEAQDAGLPNLLALAGTIEFPNWAYLDPVTRSLGALNQITYYFSEGADITLKVLYALTRYRQYGLQQISHGYYNAMSRISNTEIKRFRIDDSFYMRDNIQQVSKYQNITTGNYISYTINNLQRSDAVVIRTVSGPQFSSGNINIGPHLITSGFQDKSLVTLGTLTQNSTDPAILPGVLPNFDDDKKDLPFSLQIASHYGAIKGRVRNQYGQLGSEFQTVITPCEQKLSNYNVQSISWVCPTTPPNQTYFANAISRTPILFGGDTYINRYTEKNNMMFFYNWLYGQPDGFEYNYFLYSMIPSSRFAVNSTTYDVSFLAEAFNFNSPSAPGIGALPGRFYNLDYYLPGILGLRKYNYNDDTRGGVPGVFPFQNFVEREKGLWSVKDAYFYLANSGVRDFFVESEVLVDFRKQSTREGGKHYDPYRYTDIEAMFDMNPDIMGRLSEYIYDYSLSVSKLYNQYFSLGRIQSKYYNPEVAKFCYTYYPDRIIYSLPQQDEAIKDSWFIYLVNNYKEFKGQISGVKSINKSGIFITFKNESPLMYQGVDTLQTDLGTKITIGDGGLFSQPEQSVSNADKAYEYGSSQSRLSVISTPAGIFYMSQNQGRVFSYAQNLQEISQTGLKWWFILYMPYQLTLDFPEYPWVDNPVAGIGCQSTYDSSSSILYFAKKDYRLKKQFKGRVQYVPLDKKGRGDVFVLDGFKNSRYRLGDPYLFDDASWTLSYDPKQQYWISFHDWHPDLFIPTKDIFLSTKGDGIWKHNFICNGFCNFYGQQYGFEIEFPIVTGQTVMTTRSMEYILEAYRRRGDSCIDQHHVLDYNFDTAIVYNSEQVSGYLNLNLYPKNDVNLSLQYPKLGTNQSSYDILFSKEEQKYRFNQFWDITKNRAEFPIGSNYPPTGPLVPGTTVLQGNYSSENTWITAPDGFTRVLNPNNMDYSKSELERKKFRHYLNFLNLRKQKCDDVNVILKMSNSKNQYSSR